MNILPKNGIIRLLISIIKDVIIIITEVLNTVYKNTVENIKKMKNSEEKKNNIKSLICDLNGKGTRALADIIHVSYRYVKNCCKPTSNENIEKDETRGRKSTLELFPNILSDLKSIIENDISTDPRFKTEDMYVRLTLKEIRKILIETYYYDDSTCPCKSVISNILNSNGYKLIKVKKIKPLKKVPETNAIFDNVKCVKEKAMKENDTVLISIDAKDKVAIGDYSRDGKNRGNIKAFDHDLTNVLLTPFGILDLKTNTPHFYNTKSKVTAEFITDVIDDFWKLNYNNLEKNKLVIFLDNGPENSSRRTYFIKGLIDIANKYHIEIELAYYPPYHSKYNPVERLWSRLENIWNGYLLNTTDIILSFMKNLTWKNSPSKCKLVGKIYDSGKTLSKVDFTQLESVYVSRSSGIEKWSLIISPLYS